MDITSILEAVIALAAAVVTVFLLPWLSSKTTAQEREELLNWVDIAVAAAQQLYHKCSGQQRLDYALSVLEEKGFDVDDSVVLDAVEAAVLKLHRQLEVCANDG